MHSFPRLTGILTVLFFVYLSIPTFAMDEKQGRDFISISQMPLAELTEHAKSTLEKKYPRENWKRFRFPAFVFTNDSVETAYKIAVKKPELLAKIPCYCPCAAVGHRNLRDCFLNKNKPDVYDQHASFCITCYTQAMLAFLWAELDATDKEIFEGMQERFNP